VNVLKLVHDPRFFTEESIKERAERYGFPNNLAVELFLWDCEIAAKLQRHSDNLILKGGAAVQLHLPVEMQRGSIDIDMVTPLSEGEVEDVIRQTESSIPSLSFRRHTPSSHINTIPLVTYFGDIPSLVSDRGSNLSIKTEFLMENLQLSHTTLPKASTFALETRNIKCYTVPSLIGDKLLTLASNTIGVRNEEDVPKQIYDVNNLSEIHRLSPEDFNKITDTITQLIPIETGYRGLQTGKKEVLEDIHNSLNKYCLRGTSGADRETWRNITAFQQFYINSSQRRNQDGWSEAAWRLRFLTELVNSIFKGKEPRKAADQYSSALRKSKKLEEVKGEKIKEFRNKLLKHAEPNTPYYKELRGKSLNRVYWQIIKSYNMETVHSLIIIT
jgi:predicted nucleotidyltransferase component of viral defense system